VLGSRHSFNDIADADELLSLDWLPAGVAVDHAAGTVSCSGAVRYGELAAALAAEGMALANLASLPHISVAGAVATGTHGSGDANGSLATAVAGLELVTASGETLTASRGDPDFDGLVVGLGALGVVTRVTLDVEPAYQVRQRAYEGLAWPSLFEHLDAVTAAGYSVSLFTRWGEAVDQVWVKSRVTGEPERAAGDLFGAVPATVDRHPILGLDPVNCRPSSACPAAGPTACPTSAWASPPAAARSCSRSICCRAATRWPPSGRCWPWERSSGRCCRCRSCGRWPPTGCG
jgi:alditol oxidase